MNHLQSILTFVLAVMVLIAVVGWSQNFNKYQHLERMETISCQTK